MKILKRLLTFLVLTVFFFFCSRITASGRWSGPMDGLTRLLFYYDPIYGFDFLQVFMSFIPDLLILAATLNGLSKTVKLLPQLIARTGRKGAPPIFFSSLPRGFLVLGAFFAGALLSCLTAGLGPLDPKLSGFLFVSALLAVLLWYELTVSLLLLIRDEKTVCMLAFSLVLVMKILCNAVPFFGVFVLAADSWRGIAPALLLYKGLTVLAAAGLCLFLIFRCDYLFKTSKIV